jgi:hypothetical protein
VSNGRTDLSPCPGHLQQHCSAIRARHNPFCGAMPPCRRSTTASRRRTGSRSRRLRSPSRACRRWGQSRRRRARRRPSRAGLFLEALNALASGPCRAWLWQGERRGGGVHGTRFDAWQRACRSWAALWGPAAAAALAGMPPPRVALVPAAIHLSVLRAVCEAFLLRCLRRGHAVPGAGWSLVC